MKLTLIVTTITIMLTTSQIQRASTRAFSDQPNELDADLSSVSEESEIHNSKTRPPPPLYIDHLLEELSELSPLPSGERDIGRTVIFTFQNKTIEKPSERLFNAWLPTDITEYPENRTKVTFQQDTQNFGNFTSSQITLTLLNDVELLPETHVSMFTHWQSGDIMQQELIQTQPILQGKRFYTFDITQFISSCIKYNMTEPYLINISFQAFTRHNQGQMLDFKNIFDTQVNRPIIVFMYRDFTQAKSSMERLNRRRRSTADSRPHTQCQRREFKVSPEDIDWFDVVSPQIIDLGFCSGTCPFPLQDGYYNYTLHNFFMDRYRNRHTGNVPNGFPVSRCTPIKYKPLMIAEEKEPNNIIADMVYDLSVETCGCR